MSRITREETPFGRRLLRTVEELAEDDPQSFYIASPPQADTDGGAEWLKRFEADAAEEPFAGVAFGRHGGRAAAVRYDPRTRRVAIDLEHPFIARLTRGGAERGPAELFARSEVALEESLHQLYQPHPRPSAVFDFLRDRDRVLRRMAGAPHPTTREDMRVLAIADRDAMAVKRATDAAFRIFGLQCQAVDGAAPQPDGMLLARLGWSRDYRIVYCVDKTNGSSTPTEEIDLVGLDSVRRRENADFGFFVAAEYDPDGELDRKMHEQAAERLTLITVDHLRGLARLHLEHGIPPREFLSLFEKARTAGDVDAWMAALSRKLAAHPVPLELLLHTVDAQKPDKLATPNVAVSRVVSEELKKFTSGRLTARLRAVEAVIGQRRLAVNEWGRVVMRGTADQIIAQFEQQLDGAMRQLGA